MRLSLIHIFRLHLTAASALGGVGDECGEEKHIVSKLEKTLEA